MKTIIEIIDLHKKNSTSQLVNYHDIEKMMKQYAEEAIQEFVSYGLHDCAHIWEINGNKGIACYQDQVEKFINNLK